ncbi:uncharacterized protein LOC114151862 isoform X2 [Xiphophorus couchianus]|uniref:uncharacterized protein LOC114151862 isoform X2 n=1 Tax=Xiphophorus couchianus TaxID=32473 RepID=UPI001015DA8B|nr:uncharacterized protein LOC114151862 isoform X2 [Xiphophorus couchianus]
MLLQQLLVLLVSQHALGVEVFDGMESVQLPCQVNVSVSMESTVVWSREDLRFSTVHIHQQSGDDLSEQNPRYSNRTMMSKDALQTGDLSLTLKNPTVSDSETYTCTVRRFGRELSRIHVHLQVKERPHPTWLISMSVVLILFFVLAAVFGLVFYRRYKRIKHNPVYKLQVVKTAEGAEAVVLPFKTKVHLPPTATVEWRRIDTDQVVHLYPSTLHWPEMVSGLTQMEDNPFRTGDLSLTLYSPNHCDNGLYVCTVQKGGHNLKQKVVSLFVEEHLVWSDTNFDQTDHMPERSSLRQSLKSSLGGRFYYNQPDLSAYSLTYDRDGSQLNRSQMDLEMTPDVSRSLPIFQELSRLSVGSASELSFSSFPRM